MKSPKKLQEKLQLLCKKDGGLTVMLAHFPLNWDDQDLDAMAWMVQDYVNRNDDVIEDVNAVKDWLDEYRFFKADGKGR